MAEPCRYHQSWNRSEPTSFVVVRCAHLGDEFINDMRGRVVHVVARVRGLDLPEASEYIHVASDQDAEQVWAEMNRRMLDDEPFGLPYPCGRATR